MPSADADSSSASTLAGVSPAVMMTSETSGNGPPYCRIDSSVTGAGGTNRSSSARTMAARPCSDTGHLGFDDADESRRVRGDRTQAGRDQHAPELVDGAHASEAEHQHLQVERHAHLIRRV